MTCDLQQKILAFDCLVPRYTSYPTAPHFKAIDNSKDVYEQRLHGLPHGTNLSLYLHTPYCAKMCHYCGCHTKITQRYAPVEDYIHLMMREIDMLGDQVPNHCTVSHIHFGGGSPGMIRACDFEKIMHRLRRNFAVRNDAEIAIEIDPRGLTEGRVATYAATGVNRISLGVQDFNDRVLQTVNREQPFSLSYNAVNLLHEYGIDDISFDLLYGLPYQTADTIADTVEKALLLSPRRISLFGYAHVPWMKKHMRLIDDKTLPSKDARLAMFTLAGRKLIEAGYQAIGIDHFAKPDDPLAIAAQNGTLRRNFQGYTTDDAPAMIGIGASSIGECADGYIQNCVDIPLYKKAILGSQLPAAKYTTHTADDLFRRDIIHGLMCDLSVNLIDICKKHGHDITVLSNEINDLRIYEDAGLISYDPAAGQLTVHADARPITRVIAAIFDTYLDRAATQPKHAKAI